MENNDNLNLKNEPSVCPCKAEGKQDLDMDALKAVNGGVGSYLNCTFYSDEKLSCNMPQHNGCSHPECPLYSSCAE